MANKKIINEGHYLELTDRCHVMASMFYDHVCEHPLAIEDKEIKKLTNEIAELHFELYQFVANKMFEQDEKKKTNKRRNSKNNNK